MRNPPTLIEPSNAERATWPDCTRSYVERLESFYDDAPPYGLEDSASAPDGPQLEAQALAHLVDVLGDDGETESEVASVDPPAPVDPLDALREDVAKLAKIVQLLANSIVIDDGILATTRDIFERNQRVS